MASCLSPQERLVNNPGGGHCMFYAASLLLVRLVQAQARSDDPALRRVLLHRWQALDTTINEADLLQFNTHLPAANRALWDRLQHSVRVVIVNTRIEQLQRLSRFVAESGVCRHEVLFTNRMYRQFYRAYAYASNNTHFNFFCRADLGLPQAFAVLRAQRLSWTEECERLAALFLQLLRAEPSPIVTAIHALDQANTMVWGTDNELEDLADALQVNFDIRSNRADFDPNSSEEARWMPRRRGCPTLRFFNLNNNHWMSIVPADPSLLTFPTLN